MRFNELPGDRVAYGVRAGEGPRHLVGGMVVSSYATGAETEGAFCLAMMTGGRDAGLPLLRHAEAHTGIFVREGALELALDGRAWRIGPGDYASIPPGTGYGYRSTRNRTVLLTFQTGSAAGSFFSRACDDTSAFVQPAHDAGSPKSLLAQSAPDGCDTEILGPLPAFADLLRPAATRPETGRC